MKKTIALVSGGKDSILAILAAYQHGYEPTVIVNIAPGTPAQQQEMTGKQICGSSHIDSTISEIDSYMFQTVGYEVVQHIAECMGVPLRRTIVCEGQSRDQSLLYTEPRSEADEVETLFQLLKSVKEEFPEVVGVTSGAILSNYQRHRVENVCRRLGISSLAYLWHCSAVEVLDMAAATHVCAILVKTASYGLDPSKHIGRTLMEMRPTLEKLEAECGSHMAGEGGEFETIVLDCPLYKTERLEVDSLKIVIVDDNDYSRSGHCRLTVRHVPKTEEEKAEASAILEQIRNGDLQFPNHISD